MPCCGAEPAGAPAILTQRAARGKSGRLWRRSSRACRRRLMSGKLSLPSGKVFSQQAERRGIALLAALCCAENPQNSRDLDTNKDYDTGGRGGCNHGHLTDPTDGLVPASPAARLLEAEQACSSLTCYLLSSVVCCGLVCSFGTLECWLGGATGREDVALRYVYADSGCVAATLAVCLVSLFLCLCVARACRHHLSRVHP